MIESTNQNHPRFSLHPAFAVIGVITFVVVVLLILWYTVHMLLLVFTGVLAGLLLRSLGDWLSEYTRIPHPWSLTVVVLGLLGLVTLFVWLLAPELLDQFNRLVQELPRAAENLWDKIEQYGRGQQLGEHVPDPEEMQTGIADVVKQAAGFLATTVGAVASFFVVLFFGLYFAYDPHPYLNGLIRLVPSGKRKRAGEILHTLGFTLRWWIVGRVIDMLFVGVLSGVGLWLLGVPLALTIGILAALLNFIPYIGPLIAAVPAILLALTDGGTIQALYVTIFYTVVQTIETYVVTPMVQQKMIALPPVLVLFAQLAGGVMLGILGILLATPITAVVMVLVKMIYIEDILGEEIEVAGEPTTHDSSQV